MPLHYDRQKKNGKLSKSYRETPVRAPKQTGGPSTEPVTLECPGCSLKYRVTIKDNLGCSKSFTGLSYIFKCPICWTPTMRGVSAFSKKTLFRSRTPVFAIPDYINLKD